MSQSVVGRTDENTLLADVIEISRSKATATIGTLIIKSYTTAERDALTASSGMLIYNSTTSKLNVYTSAWEVLSSSV